ncbi:MAG: hypothetical protein Q8Q31_03850 [Nanoarchaeota archaeon]|nr:hypothetical protein [Nanoarchaeota archaeon]
MCYTPFISAFTAIIEWVLALILIAFYRKSCLTPFFAVLLFLLGLYQASEYFLCMTERLIWVNIGFIAYSFLPAIGLHSVLHYYNLKRNILLLYMIPVIYTAFSLLQPNFVVSGTCMPVFVQAVTTLSLNSHIGWPYMVYYGGFIGGALAVVWYRYSKIRTASQKKISLALIIGILLMTLPTYALIMVLPSFGIMFPSVLCHFALLLAIFFFWAAYLDARR